MLRMFRRLYHRRSFAFVWAGLNVWHQIVVGAKSETKQMTRAIQAAEELLVHSWAATACYPTPPSDSAIFCACGIGPGSRVACFSDRQDGYSVETHSALFSSRDETRA
jgi:hypothetical protein